MVAKAIRRLDVLGKRKRRPLWGGVFLMLLSRENQLVGTVAIVCRIRLATL
jgi:hypothetical protein